MLEQAPVIFTTSYPSSPGDPSGHFVRAHAKLIAKMGKVPVIMAPNPVGDANTRPFPLGGQRLFAWPGAQARFRQNPLRLTSLVPFLLNSAKRLARLPPRQLHCHWLVPCGLWGALFTPPQTLLEIWCHGADIRLLASLPKPLAQRLIALLLQKRHLHFRFASAALLNQLCEMLPARTAEALRALSQVSAPPLELEVAGEAQWQQVCSQWPLLTGTYWVCVGRLLEKKGQREALLAHKGLSGAPPLVVVGSGPYAGPLRQLAGQSKRVLFTGELPRPLTLKVIANSQLLLHLSSLDNAPSVVREARQLGKPVVASPIGEVTAWAKSDRGIQIAPDHEQGLMDILKAYCHTVENTP